MPTSERHAIQRVGWLRAAVLGANDGLVSMASLLVGVAAANVARSTLVVTALVAVVGGALSMATGEYLSVSAQRDAERADLELERAELAATPESELSELTAIYRRRGLSPELARQVAEQLTAVDALEAHARDELGLDPGALARPLQAAVSSAAAFVAGALAPALCVVFAPAGSQVPLTFAVSVAALGALGALGARAGGAHRGRGALRVVVGGTCTMLVTIALGRLVGTVI